eukprot:jgi/Psemu1/31034/gm1.31034_g
MDCILSTITIPIVLQQPKIFVVQGFHIRFYSTSPDNDSEAAGMKNLDKSPLPKKRRKSQSPSKGASKYITQGDNVSEEGSKTAARTNVEPAVVIPVPVDNVSEEVSHTAARTNEEPAVVTPVDADSQEANETSTCCFTSEVCGKESWISTEWSDFCKYGVREDYEMNKKWDNFQSLLWHVHVERQVWDTRPRLYGRNVVNYIIIKKYMILYREILVWYMDNVDYPPILVWCMDNVDYPPVPEKMGQQMLFYTKRGNGSSHDSQDYVAVMKKSWMALLASWYSGFQ